MKIKTADLLGPALDWAVAVVEGLAEENSWTAIEIFKAARAGGLYWYSTDWSQGGPRIASGKINIKSNLARVPERPEYDWLADCPEKGLCVSFNGPTPLIAAMRCYVASRLGDEVDIPDELV